MKSIKSLNAEQLTEGLDLSKKNILVTGCNPGTGIESMRVLALRGARVFGAANVSISGPLDCIIANAGAMAIQERIVKHGIEAHMLVNHVGHYMLIRGYSIN